MLCQSNRPKTIRRHASRHSWFGLPFRIPRTPSQLRYSPAPIEAPSRLAATSSALRFAPSYEGRRCVDSALCKRRMTMAPTELAESPPSAPSLAARSSRLVRPAFGYATPQLRPCLRFTPTRSGHATLASVARGRSASDAWYPLPLVPVIAEARAHRCALPHAHHPPSRVFVSRTVERIALLHGETRASCRGRGSPTHDISSIQRCPQASPIDRSSPLTRPGWSLDLQVARPRFRESALRRLGVVGR